jgi:sarcosine oxidase/L-pipecolate oxidase
VKQLDSLRSLYRRLIDAGGRLSEGSEWLDDEDAILEKTSVLERNKIQGWKAIYSRDGGWLAAAKAINAVGEVLKAEGVKLRFGR